MFTPRWNHHFLGIALSLIAGLPLRAADWPTYNADNSRTGATSDPLPAEVKLLWSIKSPAPPRLAWSSGEGRVIEGKLLAHRIRFDDAFRTVVAEGRVYYGSTVDHQVHCVDLLTGQELWSFCTGGPVRLAPTIHSGKAYFGSDDGLVYCVTADTGELVWQRQVAPLSEWLLARGEMVSKWPIRTGITIHNGIAYYGAGIFPHEDIFLQGVDANTGALVWREDNISSLDGGRNDLSPQGYLLAKDNLLVVPSGGSLPAVFDLTTGKMLHKRTHSWRSTAGGVVGGTKAILADGQIYSAGEHHLLAMAEKTGDVGFGYFDGHQMVIQGDQAYVATGARVSRLNRLAYAENSRRRYELQAQRDNLSKSLSGQTGDKAEETKAQLKAIVEELTANAQRGIDWSVETADDQALIATGNVVVVGGEGRVVGYNSQDGQVAWTQQVEGGARGLTSANGYLLVSTDLGDINCYGTGETRGVVTKPAPTPSNSSVHQQAAGEILSRTGIKNGFCLVLGGEEGGLAEELARQSQLKIYVVEPDKNKADAARRRLLAAGLYGHRVVVHHFEFSEIPYSNYFANLVVSDRLLSSGDLPVDWTRVARHVKPLGGKVCLGGAGKKGLELVAPALATCGLQDQSEIQVDEGAGWVTLTRLELPGAADWSHQYGSAANTAVSEDKRISGDLGVLWYGDPGPGDMVNRHEGAVGPLSLNGKLIVQGENTIKAYDAYNGAHLWTHENPASLRTGVFQNQNPGNLASGENALFHFIGDQCLQLDLETGAVQNVHPLPPGQDNGNYEWGYVAVDSGRLYGTATVRKELEARQRRRGKVTEDATDSIFAIDIASGKHLWAYTGKSISHHTIAISPEKVFFIDSSITSEQREEILRQDKTHLATLEGKERELAEERAKNADVRMAVGLNAQTGEKLWSNPVDVTDCSDIGIGGGKLTMMFSEGKLVLCGANANGHYWKQFVAGEFERRRMVVLSADDGYTLWKKDANYRNRPIVIGGNILAEPWMYDLETGEQITRSHPVTGEQVPWSIMRTGHHCGMLTACDSGMVMFRSGSTGFFDLNADEGVRHFSGHRLGCWINAIAANGLIMIPEASAGCVCQFSIASTIVMEPREIRRPWTIYSAVGATTPVKHLAVNLGAPGDRKDALGQIWLSYPRRDAYQKTSLDVALPLDPKFSPEGAFDLSGDGTLTVASTENPWLYTSWAEGLQSLTLPLLGEEDAPAKYTIRLHFADCRQGSGSPTQFDVYINGEPVLENLSLPVRQESTVSPLVKEIPGVLTTRNVLVELRAKSGTPLLNAVEAIRE